MTARSRTFLRLSQSNLKTGFETNEVYFKLHELCFDGFSTDYPSEMFKAIRELEER